jgi:hypothetical protein
VSLAAAQVDEYCASTGLTIVGYYHANERSADCELGHLARKVGERLQSRFNSAVIALVHNDAMTLTTGKIALTAYTLSGNVWMAMSPTAVTVDGAVTAMPALAAMVKAGVQHTLNDFDAHLDDVTRPWLDQKLGSA